MHRLINELNCNTELISPRSVGPHSNSVSFVPFLNERDALGRLIGVTSRRYDPKRDMPRGGFGNKNQLLSKIYQESCFQKNTPTETKGDETQTAPSMDFWRSEEILPKIKKSDLGLGQLKINKTSIKSRMNNKSINSARDLPERIHIPPIGFYDVSKSIPHTKQKQKVAIIFEEHRKYGAGDLEMIKEGREEKTDRSHMSNLAKNNPFANYQIKSERRMKIIENKPKEEIPQKDSAANFVDKRSYFKRIKSREDEDMYVKYQQAMNHKFNEFREKLNKLKGSINQE